MTVFSCLNFKFAKFNKWFDDEIELEVQHLDRKTRQRSQGSYEEIQTIKSWRTSNNKSMSMAWYKCVGRENAQIIAL